MDALLATNAIFALCLAWAAWRQYRRRNRRDAGFLGAVSSLALAISAATWLHVLDHGW
ncbi:hypothetical protein [Massilia sp. BSC265]|uniref:hypothetical protein n=1 Tax=Massilia sp. BSC265 TaxID=1549812 RepID=UPI0013787B85|nr:hypothetical protein [Massilia sp. BSC265]